MMLPAPTVQEVVIHEEMEVPLGRMYGGAPGGELVGLHTAETTVEATQPNDSKYNFIPRFLFHFSASNQSNCG